MSKADSEKEAGNEAYRRRDFDIALTHYKNALALDPHNVAIMNNIGAVYLEMGSFDECIEECTRAIDTGREHRANYKLIAKALARIGTAYMRKDNLLEAKKYYEKSLSEYRDPELVKKTQELEKKIKEHERLAYEDPAKADEEREAGNNNFKSGRFPDALKHYSEAIRRNPRDARLYSNRAACYMKLAEFALALADCEHTLNIDPKFVKGWLRKGHCLLMTKACSKAAEAFRRALELDESNEEAREGLHRALSAEASDPEAARKRALDDPEVQAILADPAMQLILQQMQSNPAALREHLENPGIAEKIKKLIDSGLIAIRSGRRGADGDD
jgi:stress-induced-phosphoprotein 1